MIARFWRRLVPSDKDAGRVDVEHIGATEDTACGFQAPSETGLSLLEGVLA
jgi:hypothetical protein